MLNYSLAQGAGVNAQLKYDVYKGSRSTIINALIHMIYNNEFNVIRYEFSKIVKITIPVSILLLKVTCRPIFVHR